MKLANLKHIKAYRLKSYQALLLVVGIIFGILIVGQWKSLPSRVSNPLTPYLSLKDTRDTLQSDQSQLKNEITNDQNKISDLQKNLKSANSDKGLVAKVELEKALSGLTKVQGQGASITLDDSKQGAVTEESIVHASDLRDLINLLWGSRAEAISINNERVVYNTSIDCIVNTILVNNSRLSTPFKIDVIGDQTVLLAQVRNRDNLSDLYQRHDSNGLVFNISPLSDIQIGPFSGSFDLQNGVN